MKTSSSLGTNTGSAHLQKHTGKGPGLLPILVLVMSIALQATATEYRVLVDDHNRPLPGQPPAGWYYNCMGGDRGLIRDVRDPARPGVAAFSKSSSTIYRGTLQRTIGTDQWEFFGFWQSLGRPISQKHQLRPSALFHPLIRSEYQGQLVGVDVKVNRIASPSGRSDLMLKLELKGFDGSGHEVSRAAANYIGRSALIQSTYPRVFRLPVNPRTCGKVGLLTVVLDRALPGDSLEVDNITLRVKTPQIPPKLEPLLFSLAMLLDNYDDVTHMVQDRANFPNGRFENVPATAKLAKLLALGIKLNIIDRSARSTIDSIARTLLHRVPRGPARLWPHFTKKGGRSRVSGTEWASGDTAYAALDLLVALKLIGDPNGQIPDCLAFLRSIDWAALYRPGQGYSHGFNSKRVPLTGNWRGFGMETMGVQLAALVGGGPLAMMDAPPSDTGSGFILHAGYPIVPAGVDRWGNDWPALRRNEVNLQLGWYSFASHPNPFLVSKGLFGLSAAECPKGWDSDKDQIYQPYGLGGRISGANDGNRKVVAPHYSGMVAALVPSASSRMWARLKQMGLVSPMNMVDSLAMNPRNGKLEVVNFLKGSWNLALFAEGWMMAQPGAAQFLENAVASIPELNNARNRLMPVVAPLSRSVGHGAGTTTFSFAYTGGGTMRYTASESVLWLDISGGASGTNRGTITISFLANPGTTARTGTVTVTASGADGSPWRVTVIQAGMDGFEPDNLAAAAKPITNGQTQNRVIHTAGNSDWVKFTVGNVGAHNLQLETAGSSGDTQLWLYKGNGMLMAYDDNSGRGAFSRIAIASLLPGTYYLRIREYGNDGVIPAYTLRASWLPGAIAPDAYEPDDAAAEAKGIANGQTQNRSIHVAGNSDWVKFTLGSRGARNLRLETSGASGDTQMWLYGSGGTRIAYNDNSGIGHFSRIAIASLMPGTYYIKIQEYGNNGTIPSYSLRAGWTIP